MRVPDDVAWWQSIRDEAKRQFDTWKRSQNAFDEWIHTGAFDVGDGPDRLLYPLGRYVFPRSPSGVSIYRNMIEASRHPLNVFWFRNQVIDGGPWDYKPTWANRAFENFGNFNYGATGTAMFLSPRFLKREAGRNQVENNRSKPEWGSPGSRWNPWGGSGSYGDDPVDQWWIEQGVRFAENRGFGGMRSGL
jgi:hypothetical protein